VVVVPRDIVGTILGRLTEQAARESSYTAAVARGEFSNEWVDALLAQHGLAPGETDASAPT